MVANVGFVDPLVAISEPAAIPARTWNTDMRTESRQVHRPRVQPVNSLDLWLQGERLKTFEQQLIRRIKDNGNSGQVVAASQITLGAEKQAAELIAMTKQLFPPGVFDIRLEFDPDDPEDEYIVFVVQAAGEFKQIFQHEYKWHDEASKIIGEEATWLRLFVLPI